MKNRTCALFLFDGYADWEPALLITFLNQYSDFRIQTFSVSGQPIVSMGGLTIKPDQSLAEMEPVDFDLLVLPGGEAWEQGGNKEVNSFIRNASANHKTIAAICAATTRLGSLGLLDTLPHTSNTLEYLKEQSPAYKGEAFYQHIACVSANGIITANGAGMIEFTYEVVKALNLLDAPTLEAWKELYKSGGMVNNLVGNE